jgi:hypothetical protein
MTLAGSKDGDGSDQASGSSSSSRKEPTSSSSSLSITSSTSSKSIDLLKLASPSVSLKRVAPGSDRTSFHSTAFNDVGHSPEKKRRKHATSISSITTKDLLTSSGAISFSGLSDVLAADGSHPLLHRARSASSTISSSPATASLTKELNTQTNVFSRLTKTIIADSLMPPPPPLSGDPSDLKTLVNGPKKSRPVRLNPNTGLLESSETSSEGEAEQELECRSLKSLDLAITNHKKASKPTADLKLKLKLPPSSSSTSRSSASTRTTGVVKRPESQQPSLDEPKLPKLILSMRDKTVKMAGSKSSFVESGREEDGEDYDDGDEGDDDDEEFDSIKMKNSGNGSNVANDRLSDASSTSVAPASAKSDATCDSRNEHLESTAPEFKQQAPEPSRTTNNHNNKNNDWSKPDSGIKCNDEINLRLSADPATTTSTSSPTTPPPESTNSLTSEQNIREKEEVFQQLVIGESIFCSFHHFSNNFFSNILVIK